MTAALYNNIGIPALAIVFSLPHAKNQSIPLSKAILLMPFVTNRELLSYLAHGAVKVKSLEKLIIERPEYFSNFNDCFYDTLITSVNAIQLLANIDITGCAGQNIYLKKSIRYHRAMGQRAKKICSAAPNLAMLLEDTPEKLYLNLRIKV